jgi:hypothetical protein
MSKMYTFMYEPMTRQNEYIVNGGIIHAVNTSRIEDVQFWGDMARVCLVSGAKFNVTRDEAILLLDSLDRWHEGASKELAYMEDAVMKYESAKRDEKGDQR